MIILLEHFYFENALTTGGVSAGRAHEEQAKVTFAVHSECSVSKLICSRTEACMVLRPANPGEICLGNSNCFLLGEAAGLISPSSLEGLSYAFDSARILAGVINGSGRSLSRLYRQRMLGLTIKLAGKMLKSLFLFSPSARRLIMGSGISSLPVNRK